MYVQASNTQIAVECKYKLLDSFLILFNFYLKDM